jgi:cell division protein ZapE
VVESLSIESLLQQATSPVVIENIITTLEPPSHFSKAEFSNYIPDPAYSSQQRAVDILRQFINEIEAKQKAKSSFFLMFSSKTRAKGSGIYLDGGFGVGKTHLLASAYHSYSGAKKAYLSFQELMYLVGLQKLDGTFSAFKDHDLLVIDEFELDDPANSRISTNLLGQLFEAGVHIITSSNTPPGALGEERFSDEDFRREIGELSKKFRQIKIDGEDYRISHNLHQVDHAAWYLEGEKEAFEDSRKSLNKALQHVVNLGYRDLTKLLSSAHPMKIRTMLAEIQGFTVDGFERFSHPHEAHRFVYFIDKCYDDNIALSIRSDVALKDIFHPSIFNGGDTKKYRRTLSRLNEMTQVTAERLSKREIISPE